MTVLSKEHHRALRDIISDGNSINFSDRKISKMIGISQPTVSKYRKKVQIPMQREFVRRTIDTALPRIDSIIENWENQKKECRELIDSKKKILIKDTNGNSKLADIELEPLEKLQLLKQIAELDKYIAFIGTKEEISGVIKWINQKFTDLERRELQTGILNQ